MKAHPPILLQSGLDEKWWAHSHSVHRYQSNVQNLVLDGKTPYERRLGERFCGAIVFIPFGSMSECHPISAKGARRLHQFGQRVLSGIFVGCALYAERIWKGDIIVADDEELKNLDASEIHARRLNAEEVLAYSCAQMEQFSLQEKVKKSKRSSQLGIHPTKEQRIEMILKEERKDMIQQKKSQRMT